MSFTGKNRGSATILTLLISAVIITVGISFNWLVKEHLKAAVGLKEKSEAMLKARSVYDGLIFGLLTGSWSWREALLSDNESLPGIDRVALDGSVVTADGDVTIRVRDSNGMLSLSNLNQAAFRRLIRMVAPEKTGVADIVTDSLLDWTDTDKFVRLNGAEDTYYMREGKPYRPRNYAVQYKDELALIRGLDSDLYGKLSPFITLLPNSGFNPNTASDEVLAAYLDLDAKTLANLRAYLKRKPVFSDTELFSLTGRRISSEGGAWFVPLRFMEIEVGAGRPKTFYSVKAGVDLRLMPSTPYSIVYWKED